MIANGENGTIFFSIWWFQLIIILWGYAYYSSFALYLTDSNSKLWTN
jgi:hypothetical protein